MTEEAYPEAAAILSQAGWAPHDAWNVYTRDTLVMGFQPDGQGFHVKNWAKVQAGDRAYSEDTPDTPEEAAAWLVARFKPVEVQSEAEETPRTYDEATAEYFALYPEERPSESNGETASIEGADVALGGDDRPDNRDDGRTSLPGLHGPLVGEWEETAEGSGSASNDLLEPEARGDVGDDLIDADFEDAPDLGAELLEDEDFALPELPAPDPLDFAPDEIEPENHSPGAFIFGDNLAHDRLVRIGQLAEQANALLDAAKAGYSDAEHDAVRSHVVTNMNAAGAYVGGDQAMFDRFIALETVTARVRRIERYRDERQDFIRSADREAVAAFEPAAGWP